VHRGAWLAEWEPRWSCFRCCRGLRTRVSRVPALRPCPSKPRSLSRSLPLRERAAFCLVKRRQTGQAPWPPLCVVPRSATPTALGASADYAVVLTHTLAPRGARVQCALDGAALECSHSPAAGTSVQEACSRAPKLNWRTSRPPNGGLKAASGAKVIVPLCDKSCFLLLSLTVMEGSKAPSLASEHFSTHAAAALWPVRHLLLVTLPHW